jgi:hypothetical protein
MLSTQRAIWKYWQDILYAWAGATTLDFAPLFFMVLLAIAYDLEHQSITGQNESTTGQYGSDTSHRLVATRERLVSTRE